MAAELTASTIGGTFTQALSPLRASLVTIETYVNSIKDKISAPAEKAQELSNPFSTLVEKSGNSKKSKESEDTKKNSEKKTAHKKEKHQFELPDLSAFSGSITLDSAKQEADYNNRLNNIGKILGYYGDSLSAFVEKEKTKLNDLALKTSQSSTALADINKNFAQHNISEKDINPLSEITAKIASTFNTNLSDTADAALMLKQTMSIDNKQMPEALGTVALTEALTGVSVKTTTDLMSKLDTSLGKLSPRDKNSVGDLALSLALVKQNATDNSDSNVLREGDAFSKAISSQGGMDQWNKSFEGLKGFDLGKIEANAKKNGTGPIMAVIQSLSDIMKQTGMSRDQVLEKAFSNNDARAYAGTLLDQLPTYMKEHNRVTGLTDKTINRDFKTSQNSETSVVKNFQESFSQAMRDIGKDTMPILSALTTVMKIFDTGLKLLDKHFSGLSTVLIGVAGFVLAASAAMVIYDGVMAVLTAIATLLDAPIIAVVLGVVALIAGLYELYKHFDIVKKSIGSLMDWIASVVPKSWHDFFSGHEKKAPSETDTTQTSKPVPTPISAPGKIPGLDNLTSLKPPQLPSLPNIPQISSKGHFDMLARPLSPQPGSMQKQENIIRVKIETEKGLKATARSTNPAVLIDHGAMMGRA